MDSVFKEIGELIKAMVFVIVVWILATLYIGYLALLPYGIIATIGLLFIRPFLRDKLSIFESIFSLFKFFIFITLKIGILAGPFALFYFCYSVVRVFWVDGDFWTFGNFYYMIGCLIAGTVFVIFLTTINQFSSGHPWEQFKDALRGRY